MAEYPAPQQVTAGFDDLIEALATGGRVKSFKPHAAAFMSYLISHEGYHTGKIDLILSLNGHALPDKAHYGIWEWGVR